MRIPHARLGARKRGDGPTRPRVRTPTVLQMEAVECGAACLATILAYYGRWIPLEELRVVCGVSRDGSNAGNVVKAAGHYGLEAEGRRLELAEALQSEPPYIVFWNLNHFVVYEGCSGDTVFLNDPATGPRRVTVQDFSEGFSGIALMMRPGKDFVRAGERPSLIRSLLVRMRGSEEALAYVMTVTLFLVVPGLVVPALVKTFIDDVLGNGAYGWIFPLLMALFLSMLASGILTWLQQMHLLRLEMKLSIATAGQFFWHVLRLPVVFYTQRYVGDVAARVQSCQRVAQLLSGPVSTNTANSIVVIFYLAVMTFYSAILAGVALSMALLNAAAVRLVNRRRKDLNSNLLNQRAKLVGAAMSGLQAIETLKATGDEAAFFDKWSGYQAKVINETQNLGRITSYLSAVPNGADQFGTTVVLAIGALLIIQGDLSIGGLVAFQLLMTQFTEPIGALVGFASQVQEAQGDLSRLDDVLRSPVDPVFQDRPPDASEVPNDQLSGRIEVRNVSFRYGPLSPDVVRNFNLTVAPGQRVAIVGSSGSGKSTITRLLVGLYRPTEGEVLYDGRPIESIRRDVFTGSLAAVDQEITMFEGTVRDNLTLWNPGVPEEVLLRAARDAAVHDVIAARPDGYEGPVEEGGRNFSGGQRQRLEIARALARDPTICILDEATAALDPLTEKAIDDNLRRRGCTCIIVAHRLSTIRDCDEIVVLDRGEVAERGTHAELIAREGSYARLVGGAAAG